MLEIVEYDSDIAIRNSFVLLFGEADGMKVLWVERFLLLLGMIFQTEDETKELCSFST